MQLAWTTARRMVLTTLSWRRVTICTCRPERGYTSESQRHRPACLVRTMGKRYEALMVRGPFIGFVRWYIPCFTCVVCDKKTERAPAAAMRCRQTCSLKVAQMLRVFICTQDLSAEGLHNRMMDIQKASWRVTSILYTRALPDAFFLVALVCCFIVCKLLPCHGLGHWLLLSACHWWCGRRCRAQEKADLEMQLARWKAKADKFLDCNKSNLHPTHRKMCNQKRFRFAGLSPFFFFFLTFPGISLRVCHRLYR